MSSENNDRPLYNTGGTILDIDHTAPIPLYPPVYSQLHRLCRAERCTLRNYLKKLSQKSQKSLKIISKIPPEKSEKSENLIFKSAESRKKSHSNFKKIQKSQKSQKVKY